MKPGRGGAYNRAWSTPRLDQLGQVRRGPIDARLRDEQVRPNLFLPLAQSLANIEGQSLPAECGVRRQHHNRTRFLAQRFEKARSGSCGNKPSRNYIVIRPTPAALRRFAVKGGQSNLKWISTRVGTEPGAPFV